MKPRRRPLLLVPLAVAACTAASDPPGGSREQAASCPVSPAPALFAHGLCVCEGFDEVGSFELRSGRPGESTSGAVNGHTAFVNATDISGDWIAHGGLSFTGDLSVSGDMTVGADLDGVGTLSVGGALAVAGVDDTLGSVEVGRRAAYAGDAGPPCGCDPADLFDVNGAVASARLANDNGAIGLSADIREVGATELRLPSGSYYLENLSTVGNTRIVVDGMVALYVDGDIEHVGHEQIELAPGGTLDLYVAGNVTSVGSSVWGAAEDPSAFRLYVGGVDSVLLQVGAQSFGGAVYAPQATIEWVGDTEVAGALFARSLNGVGSLSIRQHAPRAASPDACEPPPAPAPTTPDSPADPDASEPGPIL